MEGAATAALTAMSGAACHGGRPPDGEWLNAVGSDGIVPAHMATPLGAADLVAAVLEAEKRGGRVRMTGSGHSFSDVAMTADTMLSPRGMTGCLALDRSRLQDWAKNDNHLVRVQAGSTLHQLNRRLEAVGLAFQNLGGYDAQTIVGAVSTGTHGSGLKFGPIASQIVSWQVVVAQGRVLQIEPKAGVSNPALYPRPLEEDSRIQVELRQDDDLFHAMGVAIGCLGIAYAVILKAVDLFWLDEKRSRTTWRALTAPDGFVTRLVADEGRSLPANLDHYEIYFDPYPDGNSDNAVLLTERTHLATLPAKLSTERNPRSLWDMDLSVTLSKLGLLGEGANILDVIDSIDKGNAQRTIAKVMADMEGEFPQVSYRVFGAGPVNHARVYAVELAFPLKRTVEVFTRVLGVAARLASRSAHHVSPISLRFVADSPFLLAPQQGRTTTMMEIGVPVGGRHSREILETYEAKLVGPELECRPHWGLDLRRLRGPDSVRALWPATWDKWLAAYRDLNRTGAFDGEVTDRLGISVAPGR
jgi:L-gulono-1,4-lactone dehydrogenase